ncbi:bifunctional phosphopantothenoylcysteine decarboxylase/phosphopantothenate--cysteine ligase CoaBC [Pseudohongiella sp.]|uniref:bifunctional phosphopantothenoylcysteine decarboxylase/phosphopantothenate--cysteine ligase CoaBC n=1 Tax=Pseudohongiella sp. TaxID=1979412 RepID=UPI00185BB41F|nr:bifunctional phosphopantothenoylcysteine decarboxylase/phosphopantothenate--cysteine ligase CoaBC [Pseudohongiella sp.]HDZ08065.1 bifunctional phosphopantothenoylcysteine decarboxylase/phosphopantothenate--cysteine ligase CoaBC [Pseudohongiella sp.]HEA64092.1 bifunctional phosphopantothenoylcysteine decarboxylase/phosphopantothenate--cysteine ligase CoaBC [Pseudohongiella sp.]
MATLANKRILLGMTGGIAAYKCAELTRLLTRAGADVRVVMTTAATEFITPLTMQALSGHRVHLDLLDVDAEAGMGHIELARWPDLIVVAPASADFLARMVGGQAGDLLTTLLLASRAPVVLAPAMNQAMWLNPATQDNLLKLRDRGCHIAGPASGSQACGDTGPGRMLEPADIADACAGLFVPGLLNGLHLTITAGPTREAIDPVRFISNHSSGKMGYALATEAVQAGARVTLISGPVNLPVPDRVHCIAVTTAQEMLDASLLSADNSDVFIGVAAVADYRVSDTSDHKIKKTADTLQLNLVRNPDIIGTLAALEKRPLMVGFAAETQHIEQFGREKLQRKNLDLLFANDATATFNSDDICATALWGEHGSQTLGPANKNLVARQMLTLIAERVSAGQPDA